MSGKMFAFVCSVLLLVISLSKSQQNSTNEDDNLTIRYDINTDSTTNYNDEIITMQHDLHKNLMNNTQNDEMQHEFHMNTKREDLIELKLNKHSMQNNDDEQKSMKSNTNLTYANHKRNFTAEEVYETVIEKNDSMSLEVFKNFSKDANETIIVPNEMCQNDTCIQLCCSLGERLVNGNCIPEEIEYVFPNVYTNDSTQSEKKVNELFQLSIYDSCQEGKLLPRNLQSNYKIFTNGSLYFTYPVIIIENNGSYQISKSEMLVEPTSYCLAVVDRSEFQVFFCFITISETNDATNDDTNEIMNTITNKDIMEISVDIASILLLGSAFLVYSILPELRNKHGFMLRNYNGSLTVVYGIRFVHFLIKSDIQYPVCVTIASLEYFCYMASFFWLNVMSFDMWCTFRGFSSLQKNVRQREKRKLIYYTIFAWGCPFMLAILCVSMDILSAYVNVPPILRPKFYLGNCWFFGNGPYLLYYYVLSSMCVINSVCLSIYTAIKIERFKKESGPCLKDSENKCFNDNKKWFNLYLQLFIVLFILMGIEWLMITASLAKNVSIYYHLFIWYGINFLAILQSLCVFIIFVCKKRIKRMLFKRFGIGLSPNA